MKLEEAKAILNEVRLEAIKRLDEAERTLLLTDGWEYLGGYGDEAVWRSLPKKALLTQQAVVRYIENMHLATNRLTVSKQIVES